MISKELKGRDSYFSNRVIRSQRERAKEREQTKVSYVVMITKQIDDD